VIRGSRSAGKPEEARTALGEALSGLDDHAVKQQAVFLTDLATTSVRGLRAASGMELPAVQDRDSG
jgi:hypothetical protein